MSTTWLVVSVVALVALASLAWWRFVDKAGPPVRLARRYAGSIQLGVAGAFVLRALAAWALNVWETLLLGALLGLAVTVAAPEVWRLLRRKGREL